MPSIKKLNILSGTGNPVYITDLGTLSETIVQVGEMLNSFGGQAYILSGFDAVSGGFSPGIVWYNGQIYGFDGTRADNGTYLCVGVRTSGARTGENGADYDAWTEYYATTSTTAQPPAGLTRIESSPLDATVVNRLKSLPMATGAVKTAHIDDLAVTGAKIANNALLARHAADSTFPYSKMTPYLPASHVADGSLPFSKMQGTIPMSQVAGGSITADKLASNVHIPNVYPIGFSGYFHKGGEFTIQESFNTNFSVSSFSVNSFSFYVTLNIDIPAGALVKSSVQMTVFAHSIKLESWLESFISFSMESKLFLYFEARNLYGNAPEPPISVSFTLSALAKYM